MPCNPLEEIPVALHDPPDPRLYIFREQQVQTGQGSGTRQGVGCIGMAVEKSPGDVVPVKGVEDGCGTARCPHREQAGREGLGKADQVGPCGQLRGRKVGARFPEAGHDLIGDQQDPFLPEQPQDAVQAFRVVHLHGRGPLHQGLINKCGHPVIPEDFAQQVQDRGGICRPGDRDAFHLQAEVLKGPVVDRKA